MKAKTFILLSLIGSILTATVGGFMIYPTTQQAIGSILMVLSVILFLAGAIGGTETRIIRKILEKDTTDLLD